MSKNGKLYLYEYNDIDKSLKKKTYIGEFIEDEGASDFIVKGCLSSNGDIDTDDKYLTSINTNKVLKTDIDMLSIRLCNTPSGPYYVIRVIAKELNQTDVIDYMRQTIKDNIKKKQNEIDAINKKINEFQNMLNTIKEVDIIDCVG